jgi:uracil-DNA glycosylase
MNETEGRVMASLRVEMTKFLTDWRDDVHQSWRAVLDDVEPNLAVIGETLTLNEGETIFPGRKGSPSKGARADSHVFRAFDGVRPQDVNAVILGQDPYPRASRATGRSFEQGDLPAWSRSPAKVAESLRRILQVVGHHRTGDERYLTGDAAWGSFVDDIEADRLPIAPPRQFFDEWQEQGVLCINAALTISRFKPEVQRAHFALWRPVVKRLLTSLATRPDRSIVFLLWGGVARQTFKELGILEAAQAEGTADRVAVVTHVHPGAEAAGHPRFFDPPNPFTSAQEGLTAAGGPSISW